jgi:DNA polymerase I-like protein with 3'-5' exonuclease and polymerase domains
MLVPLLEKKNLDAKVIVQVHDELDIQCHKDCIHEVATLFNNASQIPLEVSNKLPPLVIPLELSVGPNWRDQKELVL